MSAGRRNRRIAIGAGAAAILGVFLYLLFGGLDRNLVYFLTPKELLERGAAIYDRPVRLGGQVVPGSVAWNPQTLDLRFRVTDGAQTVAVTSRGAPPQMFRDGIGVVVEGRYHKSGVFESTSLMVKHSNEYKAPHPGEKPAEMYRTLVREGSST